MKIKSTFIHQTGGWLRLAAEGILAAMLTVMFIAFVVQIIFRYFFNLPTGWTTELTLISWLWLVLWGAAFVNRDSEEIRIDLLTSMVGRRARVILAVLATLSIIILYVLAMPATYSYISFMKVEKSDYLKIPINWLYSIFLMFIVASLIRFVWQLWHLFRGKAPDETDPVKAVSGL